MPPGDVAVRQGASTGYSLYEAWGEPVADGGPFGYRAKQGYYADSETGLVALAYRYYEPGRGRFVNRDPVGYRGGVGLYGYARNTPLRRHDERGLQPTQPATSGTDSGYNVFDNTWANLCTFLLGCMYTATAAGSRTASQIAALGSYGKKIIAVARTSAYPLLFTNAICDVVVYGHESFVFSWVRPPTFEDPLMQTIFDDPGLGPIWNEL